MDKLQGYFLIVRPDYSLFAVLVAFTGMTTVVNEISVELLIPLVVVLLHYMAICIKDDIEDYELDKLLDHNRPIVVKKVSMKEAIVGWIGLHAIAFPVSLFVSLPFALFMALYVPIGILYSQKPFRISDRGIWGNIFFVGFTVAMPFFAGILAFDGITLGSIALCGLLWFWVLEVDLLKDFIFVSQNRDEWRRSFVMDLGLSRAAKLYSLLIIGYLLLYPLAFAVFGFNVWYFILASIAGFWLFLVSVLLLRTPAGHKRLLRLSYLGLPLLIVGSVLVGSL